MHPSPSNSHDSTNQASEREQTEPEHGPAEYRYDNAVVQASLIGLLIQLLLAVAIAVLFVSLRFSSGNWFIPFLGLGCVCAEFGLGLFLCHCIFLFPRNSPSRIVGGIGSVVLAGVQLASVTSGYGLGPLFVFVVGISITGWVMHRVFGASLSMHGEDVFQDALNTKVLLLLAPLLLILGIVPIVTFAAMDGGPTPPNFDFAATVIYASIAMLGVSVVPILTIYLGFLLLRLSRGGTFVATVLLIILAMTPMIWEWIQFSRAANSIWSTIPFLSYFLGLGLAYVPFHLRGFRPVWAKRKLKLSVETSVSFDDVQ